MSWDRLMGCMVAVLWVWSILGFVLGFTVDEGAFNMGAGVGFVALVVTAVWMVGRRS